MAEKGEKDDFNETEEAIVVIQKYLRGFQARSAIAQMLKDQSLFLGFSVDHLS